MTKRTILKKTENKMIKILKENTEDCVHNFNTWNNLRNETQAIMENIGRFGITNIAIFNAAKKHLEQS